MALVTASRTAISIPKAASSGAPQFRINPVTAAATLATASMWLGKTSRVVCSVTKGAAFSPGICGSAAAKFTNEDVRVTRELAACQETGVRGTAAFSFMTIAKQG
jgi:hypothetical protein